jgi:hypothetical protein
MKSTGWRAFLLSMCAIAACLAAVNLYGLFSGPGSGSIVGQWGDTIAAGSLPYHLAVRSIDPGNGADRAGLRAGDLIDLRQNSPLERFWLFGQPPVGRPVAIVAQRGNSVRHATIVPQTTTATRRALFTPVWFGYIWIALFAAAIAWRRSDNVQMRTLCLLLVTYAIWENTREHIITSSSLWVLASAATANVFGALTAAFWASCAGSFGPSQSPARRAAQWICYGFVAISIAVGLLKVFGIVTLWVDPVAFYTAVAGLPFVLACVAAVVCTVFAVAATQGPDQQRAIWSLVPGGALVVVGFGAEYSQGILTSYDLALGVYYLASAVNVLTPMILTYVALNRRLLDIGFVLNRAAVFAIVSTGLISAFVVVEWAANAWLSTNRTTSAVVGMIAALAIGLSIRYVHQFVDRFVDRVLFRKRYESEAALRRFAHEAGFITDRATLIDRAVSTVETSTGADVSILMLDDGSSDVDENDPALVSMRAWHRPVDLELVPGSALRGQFAFPMMARGQLVGALICGSKSDSEVYAPDESEALQHVADGVGAALGALDHTRLETNGSLHGAIAELRAAITELRELRT